MSAAPGWYDAGTPGRVRWWDGAQWTVHEADAPTPVAASAPAVGQMAAPTGPVPGWYVTPSGPTRWWDGQKWTALRTKRDGSHGTDWASTEQVGLAWALGVVFVALGSVQFTLGTVSSTVSFAGFPMLLLAALWFGIAIQTSAVLRIPAPATAPLTTDAFRPLPGEQEGPGAGWYPVSGTTTRWWTGVRWSQYTNTKFGIRPTFHAPQARAALRWVGIGVFALAAIALLIGVFFIIVGANDPSDYTSSVIGWVTAVGAVAFAGVGALVFAMTRYQTRLLFPPSEPPRS
jgi:hypothetical protein